MKALLDKSGLLVGFSLDEGAIGIDVPDECDLTVGKYVYDGATFHPVLSEFNADGPAPDFIHGVLKALATIRDAGAVTFTPDILSWLGSEETALKRQGRW